MSDLPNEEWRDVVGYEGHYMVSSLGRVKSLHYGKERIMRPYEKPHEYRKIAAKFKITQGRVSQIIAAERPQMERTQS